MSSSTDSGSLPLLKERHLILLIGLLQFFNILDFMMVMPLGPDFARALHIPANDIGLIGGSYTFAAAISGLIASLFLDQYARKTALLFCLAGLICATLCGALVWDRDSMVMVRLLAGAFGGPLNSLGYALITDYVPPERRGAAMGKVMGAFSAASVLGIPFGLELASHLSWRAPFVATGIMGLCIAVVAIFYLPYHSPYHRKQPLQMRVQGLLRIVKGRLALTTYAAMACSALSVFMIVPNISAHIQMNLDYPRSQLSLLYLAGGSASFFSMRFIGRLIDRGSATRTVLLCTAVLAAALFMGFIFYSPMFPVLPITVLFMVATSGRMVCIQTLSSKVPSPGERGAYMSVQSAVMHLSSAVGAYYSSRILIEEGGRLLHMPTVGLTSIALSLLVPLLFLNVERRLRNRAPAMPLTPII